VRIVGGEWRGRRLAAPPGRSTRPTADRVREAIFDVLASLLLSGRWQPERTEPLAPGERANLPSETMLAGLAVLDLYAGSGALGLEALSRGAAHCTFVEAARPAAGALRHNLASLAVPAGRVRLLSRQVQPTLRDEVAAGRRYTVVLVDPPYAEYGDQENVLAASLPELLSHSGLAVLETARRSEPHLPLTLLVTKLYGETRVTFWRTAS
jgi:16S rRNA (guanine966-N2)-methyltransferase